MRSRAQCYRNVFDILNRGHVRLWNLDLDLICNARSRVSPIVWRDEPARRSCRQERPAHDGSRYAKLSGPLAVYVDVDARIVQRFVVLQVPQRWNLCDLRSEFCGEGAIRSEVRSSHIDLDGCRGAEIHDLRDYVPSFKGKLASRKFGWQGVSQV